MRKINQSYLFIGLFCLAAFSSCKKDELSSKELLIYMGGDFASPENRVVVPFVHTPIGVNGKTIVKVAASATREVVADVDVTIYPDVSLIAEFNQKNGSQHLQLPAANYRIVNGNQFKINAGSITSDSLEIEILNPQALTDPKGYLLPISITGVHGEDKGVAISTTQKTAFINVTYEFNNVAQTQVPLAGTLMSRTAWSVTVSNTTSGALGPAMLDGNNSTAWRSSNSGTAAKWAIINMGSTHTVNGFQLVPNYVSANENIVRMTISTSTDNVNWTVQGVWNGTGPASGTSAASPDIKGVNFVSPVQARYFRFDITSWVLGNRVGIGELNAVQ